MLVTAVLALTVAVVPGLELDAVEGGAAVGLVVPGAGPETSREIALASLRCGEVVNSLRGELPECPDPLELGGGEADVLVELPRGGRQPNDERYPIALLGERGLLTSNSTRIPGLVSIADVATGRLEVVAEDDPLGYLHRLDDRIEDNGTARLPASALAAAIIVVLALVRPRAAVAAFATGALTNLVLGVLAVSEPWLTIPLLALGTLAGLAVPLTGTLLAGTVAAYLLAMAIDPTWVALSPLGPTQNSRFYGISNLLETMLLVPALAGAWLLGRLWFVPVAVLAVVTVAGSRFGADGGGAVVLSAGFAVLAWVLLPRRLAVAAVAVLAAAAVVALLAGPSTHVTEADLPQALVDRVELSWERATDGWLVGLTTLAALVALAILAVRGPRHPLPLAFLAAIGISLVVNDSPQDVAAGGLVGYLTLAGYTSSRNEATRLRT